MKTNKFLGKPLNISGFCLSLILMGLCQVSAFGQEIQELKIDSLKNQLHKLDANDSLHLYNSIYTQIGRVYESIHNDSALAWYKNQAQFLRNTPLQSSKKDSLKGAVFLDISYIYSIAYSGKEEVQMVLDYSDSAYGYFEKSSEHEMAIRAYNNKGLALLNQNRFEEGIAVLTEAMAMTQKLSVEKKKNYALQNLYINIGKGYIGLKQWPQAIENTRKSLAVFDVPRLRMIAYLNLSAIYLETKEADTALFYAHKSYAIADSINDDYNKLLSNINKAEAYLNLEDYSSALSQINNNLSLSQSFEYPYGISTALNQKAKVLSEQGKPEEALAALEQAEPLSRNVSDAELLIDNLENLAEAHFRLSNFKEAYRYQKEFTELKDSLNSVQSITNYNNLLLRYESSEKERKIVAQDLDLQTKEAAIATQRSRIWQISGLATAVFLLGLLGFFLFRQAQERKYKNAIIQEQEKGLAAIISATEEERKRISKDLHDGIGQKLTTMRLGINSIASKLSNNPLQQQLGELSEEFTKSAEEVRQISHQMMPRALMENGLVEALEDLLESTFKYSAMQANFEYHNISKRYPENIEISLYRIAQELLNNTLKHSQATEIQVQLMEVNKKLVLIVEDNGMGFRAGPVKGNGLYNITSRLDLVKGQVNYEPGPKTGMLATVTVPLS
ncbi:MAG: tetratricopeptide repeat protein [Owenweeksia sp.]|nr:tetratricopeptide repeat protein [Owenweeksia sp.]